MDGLVQKSEKEGGGRNTNIDFLKFLSCIAVIGLHTLRKDLSIANAWMYYLCGFATPVFFFASGYILLQRKEISYKYCFKKIVRILRIVLIWDVGVNLGILILKILLDKDIDFVTFVKDMTYRSLIQKGTMWQFWYLGAMMLLYLLLPIIHKIVYENTKKWTCFWGAFVGVCACIQLFSVIAGYPIQASVIQTFRLWTWIQYFSLGGGGTVYLQHYRED